MPDNFLTLAQQIAAKQEAVVGTAETLTNANVKLKPFQSAIQFTPDLPRFANDEVADDIGVASDFVGGLAGKLGFGCAFHGAGVLATEPSIGIYLEACGNKKQFVQQITIGSITGGDNIFAAGEIYSAASGTKTGIIEATISGAGSMRYIITTGSALVAADVVTSGGDSATTSGSTTTYAWKYSPLSYAHKTLTIQRGTKNSAGTAAADYLFRLAGALGTGKIEASALDALRFQSEFSGKLNFAGNGTLLSGQTYESLTTALQPKLVSATMQVNGVAVRPSQFSLDFGVDVQMDPDPTTTGTNGYDFARIVRREPKITLDPYRTPTTVLDDLNLLTTGVTFPFQLILGTTPNLIEINASKCQLIGWGEQDRIGRHVGAFELAVTRSTLLDDDWNIYFR